MLLGAQMTEFHMDVQCGYRLTVQCVYMLTKIHGILWASLVRAETRQTLGYICMYYLSENI